MPPKFQSSFIPKGPIAPSSSGLSSIGKVKNRSLFSFLAKAIFTISVLLALGIFGYKYYLNYMIEKMGVDLENARTALQSETIGELISLDNRLNSTKELISSHKVLSPMFEFLETATPNSVRFTSFSYESDEMGLKIILRGEARGYSALALLSDTFNKSGHFRNPVFSNLSLNERGDVSFSFDATVDNSIVSYERVIENN